MKHLPTILLALLLAAPAWGQGSAVVVLSARPVADIERTLRCVPYNAAVPSTYSLQTGKDNAEKIQDAYDELGVTKFDGLYGPGKIFAVADHDADGYAIEIPKIYGGALHSSGGTTEQLGAWDHSSATSNAFTLLHVGATSEVVLGVHDNGGIVGPVTIIGKNVANAAAASTAYAANDMAAVGIRIVKPSSGSPNTGKTRVYAQCQLCQVGLEQAGVPGGGVDQHTDQVEIEYLGGRFTRTLWRIDCPPSVSNHAQLLWTSGAPCDTLIKLVRGGDVTVESIPLAAANTILEIGSGAADNSGSFTINNFKVDDEWNTSSGGDYKIIDCQDTLTALKIRLRGSCSTLSGKRHLYIRDNGTVDCQVDIKNITAVEQAAYPQRPIPGWEAPLFYETESFATTKLWLHPTDRTGWTVESDDQVTLVNDKSGTNNDLLQATSGSKPLLDEGRMNHRHNLDMYESGQRFLVNTAPTDLDDAVGDMTIMAVVLLDTNINATSPIVSCRSATGTGGFEVGINSTDQAYFIAGGTTITSSVVMDVRRPYLIIAERNATTGALAITVEETATEGVGSTGTQTAVTGHLVVGSRQLTAGPTYGHAFEGWIGEILIDSVLWDHDTTLPDDQDFYDRRDYLRAAFGVW